MKLLWLTWKDYHHPEAGGAEVVARELATRLVRDGHKVTFLTCGYEGAPARDNLDGVEVIRVGNSRYLHPFQALAYYARHLRGKFDVVIEEVNGGAPYFSVLLERRARKFLLYHQLARTNWRYEIKPPLSQVGYHLLVPLATRLVALSRAPVVTVSESTRRVLAAHGLAPSRTHIISEGIELEPLSNLGAVKKFSRPTVLSLGAMRAMKRTLDQIRAFELTKKYAPQLQMKVAGSSSGAYGQQVLQAIAQSPHAADIEYLGRVSDADRLALMRRSHVILQTAVEEGWGLTITEAASQGTPAVAYDVDGLRDSVQHQHTGIITAPDPAALSRGVAQLLRDRTTYQRLRRAAWEWSKQITFDQSYRDFTTALGVA